MEDDISGDKARAVSRMARFINVLLANIGYPLLFMSAIGLHGFTVFTAYGLADSGSARYVAAIAAFLFPPISEAVTAYYAWRASGSMINAYSVWILAWLLLLFALLSLIVIVKRLSSGIMVREIVDGER